jgi:hypothetical protein
VIMAALLTMWREWIGVGNWLHRVFIPTKLPKHMIARSTLKRTQVGAQECWQQASIIWAWHLGQAGCSIAARGTTDDGGWSSGMMLRSNRREGNALDRVPESRAVTQTKYALLYRLRGADFHARYLLTDVGGMSVDAGFSAEGAHQKVQLGLLSLDFAQKKLSAFARNSVVYELVGPVLEIRSDGSVRRC